MTHLADDVLTCINDCFIDHVQQQFTHRSASPESQSMKTLINEHTIYFFIQKWEL